MSFEQFKEIATVVFDSVTSNGTVYRHIKTLSLTLDGNTYLYTNKSGKYMSGHRAYNKHHFSVNGKGCSKANFIKALSN